MSKKMIIRYAIQIILCGLSIFTILKFYDYNGIDILLKKVIAITLITANCIYNHSIGLKAGIEISKKSEKQTEKYYKEKLDKVV